ncbi:MAG: PilW family protein [Planctomycetota bacterium]
MRVRGFTLIELLVAIALSTILTGAVVFIFIQAQEIFTSVDAKVQVYQYARYAFDRMERDLANVVRSRDMEFFNDQAPPSGVKGRYDQGEEIPIRGTGNLHANATSGDDTYNHSFTIRAPHPYTDFMGRDHRWDSIYFKTVTVISGQTQAALIEYAMVDNDKPRPKLQRRLWRVTGVDASNPLAPRYEINGTLGGQPERQDLCLYCVDARFEVFVKNLRRNDSGDYYDAVGLSKPPRVDRPYGGDFVFEPHHNDWGGSDVMVQCYYDVKHNDGRMQPDMGVFEPNENGLFHTQDYFTFPMLREGDTIYLTGTSSAFKSKPYRIKKFLRLPQGGSAKPWESSAPPSEFRIQFEDAIEGSQPGQQTIVSYSAGYVPAALRATLVIKDVKSLESRSVQRIFKIMASGGR